LNSNVVERRQGENMKVICVLLITCLQYVAVTVSKERVIYLLFFFRSRSYPVPHRGERVKQRTVHVRNLNQNYSN
jgi:exonuclease I